MDMETLMAQAQDLQTKISLAQDSLANMQVKGIGGNGMVVVTMTGKYDVLSVVIQPKAMEKSATDLSAFVMAAYTDAKGKADILIEKLNEMSLGYLMYFFIAFENYGHVVIFPCSLEQKLYFCPGIVLCILQYWNARFEAAYLLLELNGSFESIGIERVHERGNAGSDKIARYRVHLDEVNIGNLLYTYKNIHIFLPISPDDSLHRIRLPDAPSFQ